jgi:hypothetical protein
MLVQCFQTCSGMRWASSCRLVAALRGLILRLRKVEWSTSFSDDMSLLVMVSRRAVTVTPVPSAASASSLRSAEPRTGEEPERVRSGILVNLIWWAGRCASSSSSLSSLRSLLSSSSTISFRRRRFAFSAGPTVSLLPPPVTMPPSSSSSPKPSGAFSAAERGA